MVKLQNHYIPIITWPGGCFTNVSQALQDILSKFVYCRNRTSYENFKLKLCTRAQSPALGTRTKFQLEILTINVISGMVYFREIFLESSRNVSETTPGISLIFRVKAMHIYTWITYEACFWLKFI